MPIEDKASLLWLAGLEAASGLLGTPKLSPTVGGVVCISSVQPVIPWAGHANYATAKGGVAQLVRTAAQELVAQRIRVNGVAPGAICIQTDRNIQSDLAKEKALLDLVLYGRFGLLEDVEAAVVWLAFGAADYVTGTTMFVDGGTQLCAAFLGNG